MDSELFPKISLVSGNRFVDYGCNSFCLVVKNNRKFNNLLHFYVKIILRILIKTSMQEEGDSSEEEKNSGRLGSLHSLKKISIDNN